MAFDTSILQPGDFLLYRPSSLTGVIIAVKTWTWIAHIEIYKGGGISLASRDGIGVNAYPLRLDQLGIVRRPNKPFSFAKGLRYFETVKGQKYDWLGLMCFTLAVHQGSPDRQFCSEFAHNFAIAEDLELFSTDLVPDHTSPAQFDQTPVLDTVWRDSWGADKPLCGCGHSHDE